jgi:translation initiation factor IF-3
VRRAIEFLEEGDRIKVAVQFRGRELTHPQIGRELLNRFADLVKDHGVIERAPLLEGKSMHITIASTHKPHQREAAAGEKPPAAKPAAGPAQGAAPAAAVDAAGPAPASTGE